MSEDKPRMDRRTAIKWMLAASASLPLSREAFGRIEGASAAGRTVEGYGTDPRLQKDHAPGDLWPLTLTPEQRQTAAALCDTIIPEDDRSPSASAVGVVDFIDEWISAPYPRQLRDREIVLAGLAWIESEAGKRFGDSFASINGARRSAICDDICSAAEARPEFAEAANLFARYRDLTAGGFYTTPAGRADLGYVGNVPLTSFDGPPPEVVKAAGLA